MCYLQADFQGGKKPKGVPLEIENFFVEAVNEKGWRGSGAYCKSIAFVIYQFKMLDSIEYLKLISFFLLEF